MGTQAVQSERTLFSMRTLRSAHGQVLLGARIEIGNCDVRAVHKPWKSDFCSRKCYRPLICVETCEDICLGCAPQGIHGILVTFNSTLHRHAVTTLPRCHCAATLSLNCHDVTAALQKAGELVNPGGYELHTCVDKGIVTKGP